MKSIKELKFYLKADEIMNEQVFPQSFIRRLLLPYRIQSFLRCMRILEYFQYNKRHVAIWAIPFWVYYHVKYHRISRKLGFDIPINTLGYGCRIAHQCGIIINSAIKIGNYCCLYRCSCADGHPKRIGNNVFIGTNVVIAKEVSIADGCSISAMSMLNRNIVNKNKLCGGRKVHQKCKTLDR